MGRCFSTAPQRSCLGYCWGQRTNSTYRYGILLQPSLRCFCAHHNLCKHNEEPGFTAGSAETAADYLLFVISALAKSKEGHK